MSVLRLASYSFVFFAFLTAGCGRSTIPDSHAIIEKVADQAAMIAKLEVGATNAEKTLADHRSDLDKAKADLEAAEKAQADSKRLEVENESLVGKNRSLTQQLGNVTQKLSSLQQQLAVVQADRESRANSIRIVGKWASLPDKQQRGSYSIKIEFREDGTGTISGGDSREYGDPITIKKRPSYGGYPNDTEISTGHFKTEKLDYRIRYSPTDQPGVFALYGTWRESRQPTTGFFRLTKENKAVLEGMSAILGPIELTMDKSEKP